MRIFSEGKEQFRLTGLMPERALLRLRRAGIAVYQVKKVEKNQILFCVKRKDSEKVFAIYPNVCYNNSVYSPDQVEKLRPIGVLRYLDGAKRRLGLLLGGLLCFTVVTLSEPLVFSVEFTGSDVYAREARIALEEAGIKLCAPYKTGQEDLVCSKILALKGVEFCSLKKIGHRLMVEIRTSPFSNRETDDGLMQAKHSGKIVAMTVLRGVPLKKVGETVTEGETLVGNWFETQEGGHVRVEIIARVRIACVWEGFLQAATAEEAFAQAYLTLALSDEEIKRTEIAEQDDGYFVRMEYEATETINF